tara:strand:+ start:1789 stop:2037 length:249 start_codon:yes stop_codon:yes gene_type:complete
MLESRLKELQTEIARLKEIDTKITEEVSAELFERDIVDVQKNMDVASEFISAWSQEDCNEFIEVGCSLQQDMEWANESENLI